MGVLVTFFRKAFPALLFGTSLTLAACSSSDTKEEGAEESTEESSETEDAGTDAVPAASIEEPPPEQGQEPAQETAQAEPAAEGAAPTDPATTQPAPESAPPIETASAPAGNEPAPTSTQAADKAAETERAPAEYTVQSGDTLMKISFEQTGDLYGWRKIYEVNRDKIPDPNNLVAGVVLKLDRPPGGPQIDREGEKYEIERGDTLGTISKSVYGTPRKWRRLWENNRQMIRDPNRIYAGFSLYYVITPEDRQELEQLRNNEQPSVKPAELGAAPQQQPQSEPAREPAADVATLPLSEDPSRQPGSTQ